MLHMRSRHIWFNSDRPRYVTAKARHPVAGAISSQALSRRLVEADLEEGVENASTIVVRI